MDYQYPKSAEITIRWSDVVNGSLEKLTTFLIHFEGQDPTPIMKNIGQVVHDSKLGDLRSYSYFYEELDSNRSYFTENSFINTFNNFLP